MTLDTVARPKDGRPWASNPTPRECAHCEQQVVFVEPNGPGAGGLWRHVFTQAMPCNIRVGPQLVADPTKPHKFVATIGDFKICKICDQRRGNPLHNQGGANE